MGTPSHARKPGRLCLAQSELEAQRPYFGSIQWHMLNIDFSDFHA